MRLAALSLGALAIAAGATGCHGASANKAGGSSSTAPKTLTLSLLTGDSLWAPEYAAAVERLSRGTMRIDVTVVGNRPGYEASTVKAVRAGRADLGAVGARVWDAFGVTSFRAIVAPFLIDSLGLEQRVLEGPLTTAMLRGLERAGVVGLAALPGPLRRPLGLSRALVRPSDYDGATIAIRDGGVARATFDALGAASEGYVIGYLPPVDGAELDPNTIAENGYDANARALTANVVYWPRPQTIFASRAAFDRLTPAQRRILLAAGRAALEPALARVERDEAAGLAGICGRGAVPLVTATADDLAALRRAVRQVYAKLDRDPLTRRLVAAITALRRTQTDAIGCTRERGDRELASRLEGDWRAAPSMADLVAAGAPPGEAERQRGDASLTFRAGRWAARESHSGFVWRGRYQVRGNVLRLAEETCPRSLPCPDKAIAAFIWSVYDDRLSLAVDSGTPSYVGLYATPLTRVR